MEYEEKVCDFKKYAKQTLDLMVDAYKWKMMAEECEDEEMKNKYNEYLKLEYDRINGYLKENKTINNSDMDILSFTSELKD